MGAGCVRARSPTRTPAARVRGDTVPVGGIGPRTRRLGDSEMRRNAMPVDSQGPHEGDRVHTEAAGAVAKVQVRDDVPGALIELDYGGAVLWLPLDCVVVLDPRSPRS